MPTYLVHGFRWARSAIRIYIALYDLDDAAAEWIVASASAITLLNSFYTLFDFLPPSQSPITPTLPYTLTSPGFAPPPPVVSKPLGPKPPASRSLGRAKATAQGGSGAESHKISVPTPLKFNDWSAVKLLEQYDPDDELTGSQPFAYVADYIVPVTLSVDIATEMVTYEERQRAEALPLLSPVIPPDSNGNSAAAGGTNGTSSNPGGSAMPTKLSERDTRRKSRCVGWLEKVRDQLQKNAAIGWYVVVCGDEDREFSGLQPSSSAAIAGNKSAKEEALPKMPRGEGLRGLFSRRGRSSKSDFE